MRRPIMPDRLTPGDPLIDPAEAVAIALTTSRIGKSFGPESLVVRLVLQALWRSGWQLTPREISNSVNRVPETSPTESAHEQRTADRP